MSITQVRSIFVDHDGRTYRVTFFGTRPLSVYRVDHHHQDVTPALKLTAQLGKRIVKEARTPRPSPAGGWVMQVFFDGWRAYRRGEALDLNESRDWKAGWRAAELKYRGTPDARPMLPPIPDTRRQRSGD